MASCAHSTLSLLTCH
ncbi:hypothetical protein [Amycolatopsis carbonis]